MSVLIKGMEMPKDGELLFMNIYPDGKVCVALDLECTQIATAVPVPKHGRLIAADAMKEAFSKVWKDNQFYSTITAEVVDNTPAIIEAEGEVIHNEIHTETASADR